MRPASAASPRHNAVSAASAGWPGAPAPFRSTAAALCEGVPSRSGDEAITAARYRLDVARLLRVVAERRSHFADRRLEHRVGDEPMSPDGVEQGVLRHEPARRARERAQHGERLWRERLRARRRTSALRRLRRARTGRSAARTGSPVSCGIHRSLHWDIKASPRPELSSGEEERGRESRDCRGEVVESWCKLARAVGAPLRGVHR